MNTKGIKFLAVLAVLAMAFAAFAVITFDDESADAGTSVGILGNHTVEFGGTDISYGTYGNITVAQVQNLSAAVDTTKKVITLSGNLYKLDGTNSSSLTVKELYGGTLPSNHGIAFTVSNLNDGATITLNAGTTTISGSDVTESLYQAIADERGPSSATKFTMTIDEDGTGTASSPVTYTIDFSKLIKVQLGDKKYFNLQDAIDKATAGATVTMLSDELVTKTVIIDKNITLDMGSKTLKTIDLGTIIKIKSGANISITDSSDTPGSIKAEPGVYTYGMIWVGDSADTKASAVTIEKVSITGTGYGVCASDGGSITVNSGSIVTTYGAIGGNNQKGEMNVTINGGTITSNGNDEEGTHAIFMPSQGTLTINGGTINGGITAMMGTIIINGGVINATSNPHLKTYAQWNVAGDQSGDWAFGNAIDLRVDQYTFSKTGAGTKTGTDLNLTINNGEINGKTKNGIAILDTKAQLTQKVSIAVNGGSISGAGSVLLVDTTTSSHTVGSAAITYAVNGGTFSDLTMLKYLQDGKTITISDSDNLELSAALDLKTSVINVDEAVALKITGTHVVEEKTVSWLSNGTFVLAKGASVTGDLGDKTVVKTSGSDQPVDVEETDSSGKIDDKTVADYIKDNQASAIAEATVVTMNNADAIKDAAIVVEKADVTFVAGTAVSLAGVNIEVKASDTGSNSVTFTGFTGGVSGTITTTSGTDKQTVVLDGVMGSFTISKGSVIIDDAVITGGSFKVSGGVEVKISGSVDSGTFKILMVDDAKATDKATVTVVKDDEKTFEIKSGATFQIDDSRITLQINGKLFGQGTVASKGDIVVNNGGKFVMDNTSGTITDVATKPITITAVSGATVTGKVVFNNATSKLVAYTGSDINGIASIKDGLTADAFDQLVGKDGDGGEWKASKTGTTLELKGYVGTYNIQLFANKLTAIDITGENQITYTFASTYTNPEAKTLFGLKDTVMITSITSGSSGSLDIIVDLSKVGKDSLFQTAGKALTVMQLGAGSAAGKNINGVDLSITVMGENATWTTTETGAMNIIGINATNGFVTYNSSVEVDVMSDYSAKGVIALDSGAGMTVDNADVFAVKSAGTAIYSDDANNTISNSQFVIIEGKKASATDKIQGIEASGRALLIQTVGSVSIKGGMNIAAFDVLNSNVIVGGTATITGAVNETNTSNVSFTGTVELQNTVAIKQTSTLSVKNALIKNILTNDASFVVTGDVVVADGTGAITNNGTMTNTGVIGVYHNFTNNGSFINEGTFEVKKYTFETASDKAFTIEGDEAPTATANARVVSITLAKDAANTTWNADGSADVKGSVKFWLTGGAYLDVDFSGTLNPSIDGSYKLTLSNTKKTATITLTYNNLSTGADAPKIGGKSYTLAVTGTIVNATDDVFYLALNKSTATVKGDDGMLTKFKPSTVAFVDDENATIDNSGAFIISGGAVTINGSFAGDLVTNVTTATTVNGTFTGDIYANEGPVTLNAKKAILGDIIAKGLVTIDGNMAGNITTDAGVTASGKIIGNITAKGNVVVTDLLGDITVDANGELSVNVKGNMFGTITYISKYKATKDAKEGEETTYTATLDVNGETKDGGFTVILAAGSDATASAAVVPGFFKINGTMADLATGKTVELTLTQGKILVDAIVKMKANYYLVIEKDTTIEVNKSAASLDVTEAALKVSKDATANFETGSGTPVNYGKVIAIMSFTIDDGAYSIYSDVAYALTNCNENSTLTVETDAPINSNVDIKKGVNIIVKNVTLTFNGLDVDMNEGAKITLEGTGKIVFKGTEKDATGDENIYYTVSGTIVYDDENVIVLDEVRFVAETTNTIEGVAATSTAASKMKVALTYNCGKVTINDGYATGSVELANGELAWKDVTADPTLISGTFIVGADAVFDATSLKDAYGVSKYKTSGDDYVVDDVVALPTKVGVEGTLNLLDATSIKGLYGGNGLLTIAKKITIEKGDLINAIDTPFKDSPGVIGLIVSDKDGCNKLALALLAASTKAADDPIVIAAEKVKDVDALTIAGDVGVGSIIGEESAYLKGVTVYEDAAITAPTVYVITAESTAFGSVGAQTIYMKSTDSSYAKLTYQVEYEVGEYTFYSYFESIDFDEVSDITIADSFNLSALVKAGTTKVDLTGKDVNIVIADEKTLTIDIPLIIGTPIDSIGAEGSSIVGKVIIANSAVPDYRYIVAYADVDLTLAEIYQQGGKVEAVYSFLTIDDILYATIFANEGTFVAAGDYGNGVGLSYVDKSMIPDIEGYIFTKWSNLNDDPNAAVGETSAYANAKAISVTVIVKFAEGVSYYLDGVEFAIYDTPTKVEYNSVFTAKINNTAKYEGTPLINGKNSFIVTEDSTLTVTGVNPIPVPPEPTPEPEVGDSGLSLTDILLIVLVILIAIMVVILVLRLNRS